MNEKRSSGIYNICMIIVTLVFAVGSVSLLIVGITEYRNIAVSNLETYELRTSLSYVATKVRQCDAENMVEIREQQGRTVLSLKEELDGTVYETAIYSLNGRLLEYYHEAGRDFALENGFEVMKIGDLSFEFRGDGLIFLKTVNESGQAETMYVTLNSVTG